MVSIRHLSVNVSLVCVSLVSCGALLFGGVLASQEPKSAPPAANAPQQNAPSASDGKQLFATRCAGCHGLDGRGGERAPDIATNAKTVQRSDEELLRIIRQGVPGTGMPPFAALGDDGIKSVVSHLRSLQGLSKAGAAPLPGDAAKGRALFYGKARCAECHSVSGAGGFLASDLTALGQTRSADDLRQSITKPTSPTRIGSQVVVTTRSSQKYSGIVRNEDNFSVQLQTSDGAFHLFAKDELASFARLAEPLMPTDYGSTLSPRELDDLVSFLISAGRKGKETTAEGTGSADDEEE
jgi:cytochrome c oxidase cbb3-type subunit III